MPTEIVTEVQDRPGLLADIGELFGKRNINITAAAAFTHNGKGYLHFVVDDAEPATGLLKECGCKIMTVRDVLSVSLDDQPGELGRYARRLAARFSECNLLIGRSSVQLFFDFSQSKHWIVRFSQNRNKRVTRPAHLKWAYETSLPRVKRSN